METKLYIDPYDEFPKATNAQLVATCGYILDWIMNDNNPDRPIGRIITKAWLNQVRLHGELRLDKNNYLNEQPPLIRVERGEEEFFMYEGGFCAIKGKDTCLILELAECL